MAEKPKIPILLKIKGERKIMEKYKNINILTVPAKALSKNVLSMYKIKLRIANISH
jgi:hypothetical protein